MTSVALPAAASRPALSEETDLVRQAARGHADAFSELFRRHGQPAWRLAQAVAPSRDKAVAAFAAGFSRAVRSQRSRRDATRRVFRAQVLASVYRAGLEPDSGVIGVPAHASADSPEAALTDAAFRSLPERWRAAVWLSEVEDLEPARIAAVLGVSVPVAMQLVARGRRGLAGRFAQAHQETPEPIGPVLRSVGLGMPANLADVAQKKWAAARTEHTPRFAPASAWLEDKAMRPMSVAVASLVALGVIGLAVLSQDSAVRGTFGADGTGNVPGSVPVRTCFGVPCSPGSQPANPGALVGLSPSAYTAAFFANNGLGGSTNPASGSTSGPVAAPASSASPPASSSPAGGSSGVTAPASPAVSVTPPAAVTVPSTPSVAPPSTVNLAPVATVTSGGSGATVNLLPSGSGSAVSATVGSGGAQVSVGGTTVLNTNPTPTTSTTTPSTPTPGSVVNNVVGGVTNTLSGLTKGL